MNMMRRFVLVAMVIVLLLATMWMMSSTVYPRAGFIRAIEYDTGLEYIEDMAGQIWIYGKVEDLSAGDHVAMLMFTNFTPDYIFDDVILDIR